MKSVMMTLIVRPVESRPGAVTLRACMGEEEVVWLCSPSLRHAMDHVEDIVAREIWGQEVEVC